MRVYIAGPISADPTRTVEEKKAEFYKIAEILTDLGHEAVNPLEIGPKCGLTTEECVAKTLFPDRVGQGKHSWECYMKADLRALLDCDAIYPLPWWQTSPGARIEVEVAQNIGIPWFARD